MPCSRWAFGAYTASGGLHTYHRSFAGCACLQGTDRGAVVPGVPPAPHGHAKGLLHRVVPYPSTSSCICSASCLPLQLTPHDDVVRVGHQSDGVSFIGYAAFNVVVTLLAALVLHVLVDSPLQALLGRRNADGSTSRLRRCGMATATYVYYTVLLLSVLGHVFMVAVVTMWAPDDTSYNGLGPNASVDALRMSSGDAQ